jgi:magnesium chelatase family protein
MGLLVAAEMLASPCVERTGFVGELGLDGSVRPVPGTASLVAAIDADQIVVPASAAEEAALVAGGRVRPASTVAEVVAALQGRAPWGAIPHVSGNPTPGVSQPDLLDVRGQLVARRALEIAAAGGHHLLFVGAPGSGKTMLATRLPSILPDLTPDEALEVLRIHSAAGAGAGGDAVGGWFPSRPPFRAPHHGSTEVAIVGGGTSWLRPGEISLAHAGVLFLDELGEFPAPVLDALRQPLEEHVIRVRRARGAIDLPARFLLVGAMNPCPCGEGGLPGACRCSDVMRRRYLRRLSAPLLDRFDLAIALGRPDVEDLLGGPPGDSSAVVATRVRAAREVAHGRGVRCNADLGFDTVDGPSDLSADGAALLERRLRSGALSARGLHRVRRVAQTIADLDDVRNRGRAAGGRSAAAPSGALAPPAALAEDRQAPAVLFSQGDVAGIGGLPRVAVVGTRSATRYGLGMAAELGRDLGRAGVVVVSGLAPGIDSAAHAGALGVTDGAPVVGVLGTALDVATTGLQRALREEFGARGVLLSEIPPTVHSARWRFSMRNRVIAALAHVVVVVECHHRGGSLHTVAAALARGVTVTAVPGSVRSPASAGTNRLLVEGAVPVRDVDDVLTAVELAVVTRPDITPPRRPSGPSHLPAPGPRAAPLGPGQSRVRQALDHDPATLEVVVRRSGLALGDVAVALEELADAGLAVGEQGWWSRTASRVGGVDQGLHP